MSHTNQTQHYQLPQFVGTDILNPLTDTNEAYQKIDETMYNVSQEAGQASTAVAQAVATVEAMNQRVEVVENEATALATGVEQTRLMLAEQFNALKSGGYKTGDYVINDNKLYKFIKPHTGAWNASDIEEIMVTDVLKIAQNMIAPFFVSTNHYEAGAWVIYDNKLYVFTNDHDGAWTDTDVDEITIAYAVDRIEGTLHLPTVDDEEVVCGYTSANEPIYRKNLKGTVSTYTDNTDRRVFEITRIAGIKEIFDIKGNTSRYISAQNYYQVAFGEIDVSPNLTISNCSNYNINRATHELVVNFQSNVALNVQYVDYDLWIEYTKI